MVQENEKVGPMREGEGRFRKVYVPSDGLVIGENLLKAKRDASGHQDPYWRRQDGSEVNMTGEIFLARATGSVTLSTTAQSIPGDGNSSKVRLLLPTVGDWLVAAVCDFQVTATPCDRTAMGQVFVNDSATAETGQAIHYSGNTDADRATVQQQWKVTTTAADTPVELKVLRTTGTQGTVVSQATHTTLMACIGAGGGSAVEATDHGTLTGLGDDDHPQYGALAQAETVAALWTFTSGIATDTIAERTAAAGVTIDSLLIKDGAHGQITGTGDLHTEYARPADAETWAALQTFSAGIKTDSIAEKTAATGVTIDDALIKDGSFQVSDAFAGIKDSGGKLRILPNYGYLQNASEQVAFVWGLPTICAAFGYSYAGSVACIGGQNNADAASLAIGYFANTVSRSPANDDEIYLRFLLNNTVSGLIEYGRIKSIARDVGATADGAFLFQVMKAGALATVLGVEQYGMDVTGTLGVSGLITASAGLDVPSGQFLGLLTDGITGGVKFGASGDVLLYRTAANKLALATGDTFRIISGALEFGSDVSMSRVSANRLEMASGDTFYADTLGCTNLLVWGTPQFIDLIIDDPDGDMMASLSLGSSPGAVFWGYTGYDFAALVGRMLIGANAEPAASAVLELQSTTGALLLTRLTTVQRDALTPVNGLVIYNTTTTQFEGYENGAWAALKGAS